MQVALQLIALHTLPVPLLQPHCMERAQISAGCSAAWEKKPSELVQLPRVLYPCLLVEKKKQNSDHCTIISIILLKLKDCCTARADLQLLGITTRSLLLFCSSAFLCYYETLPFFNWILHSLSFIFAVTLQFDSRTYS